MARPAVIALVHRPWALYSHRCRARDHSDAFLALVHDRPGGLEVGLRFQDDAGPNADFGDPILAVDVFQQAFGGALISRKLYAFALGQRHERQHQAGIQRADQQLFGAPDARLSLEFRRAADVHFGLAGCGRPAAASTVPDQAVVIAEGLVCFLSFHVSLQDWSWVAPERKIVDAE